jgi:hypothetical protein
LPLQVQVLPPLVQLLLLQPLPQLVLPPQAPL